MSMNAEVKVLIQEQKQKRAEQFQMTQTINNAPKLDALMTHYK